MFKLTNCMFRVFKNSLLIKSNFHLDNGYYLYANVGATTPLDGKDTWKETPKKSYPDFSHDARSDSIYENIYQICFNLG